MIIDKQIELVLASIYLGLLLGLSYSVVKYFFHKNFILEVVFDLLLLLLFTYYSILILDRIYYGVFRLYQYIFFGIGYILYHLNLKQKFEKNLEFFFRNVKRAIKYIFIRFRNFIIPPLFVAIYRKIRQVINKVVILFEKRKDL